MEDKNIHLLAAAIESAAAQFLRQNPLIKDGQDIDKLEAMFVAGARSEQAKRYHAWKSVETNIGKAAREYCDHHVKGMSDLTLAFIKTAFSFGATSEAAKYYHLLDQESTSIIMEELYVLFEWSPGQIWEGKTNEPLSKICNGDAIWLEPASGSKRNMGTGQDEWKYDNKPLVLIPNHRIYSVEPIRKPKN